MEKLVVGRARAEDGAAAAGIKHVIVVFVRDFPPHRRSDIASFEHAEAVRMLERGVAKHYKPGDRVPKPTVSTAHIGNNSVRTGMVR